MPSARLSARKVAATNALSGVASKIPGWTDHNSTDPSITLLEALAYTLTDLAARPEAFDHPAARAALASVETALRAITRANGTATAVERVNYFDGQMLTAADFSAEQDYHRTQRRRQHRALFGVGIVSGLKVGIGTDDQLVITPGAALDAAGELLEVPCAQKLPLPPAGRALAVVLMYSEHESGRVPGSGESADATRIVEGVRIELAVAPAADALVLAKLRRAGKRWTIDRRFRPRRLELAAKAR